ncbi:MAG TPA: cyclopropane-fatty-acyl-phospholipid synthase family protein [Burkholderiales bacterium]|jgi:cyclopropane-fatty-acyl-phospholipid synthase|nr:cyclopropane-fatty-acyl-phospholipid synthase family protein [Burkholderiales bacterium]
MPGAFKVLIERVGANTATPFRVRFPDGSEYRNSESPPAFILSVRHERALRRAALYGHVGVLEAYFDGELDIEGSLPAALAAGMEAHADEATWLVRLRNRWHEFMHTNANRRRANSNAEYHYALPPEFYKLWLDDPYMFYTCAYWGEGVKTLEEAQRAKADHVARKVLLTPGEEVVDVGSGFGGFLMHAAMHYGVNITSINTTGSQAEHARRQIEKFGIKNAVQMHSDFRTHLGTSAGTSAKQFDKVVSIGCLEHAGRDQLDEVIRSHADLLKPGGLGLIHFIGHVGTTETDFFIRKYVFPGGWIPSLADTIVAMERSGLEVLDIENLRRHYALTLDVWAERFDRSWERIRALDPQRFDERFRRIWRVYLYGCAEMFRSRSSRTHLFQIVFSKGNVSSASYPMTRDFLYERQPAYQEKRSADRAA